ncbi:hypothetical protein, partial [Bacillus sp. AR18-7]|uniref:hypothetical protein n=1 Tax=Bacillus sp. AR18-7 TaxID=2217821 RepID=UPI001C553C32
VEVCPNASLSHRSLSKHEKNSPPPDQKVEGYFSKFYYFMLFLLAKIKKDSRVLGTLKGFPTLWTLLL